MKMNYVTPQVEEMRYLANGDVMDELGFDIITGSGITEEGVL